MDKELKEICRTCKYRRKFYAGRYTPRRIFDRTNSYCAYLDITNEVRGCQPTDEFCEKYEKYEKGEK